MKLTLIPYRTVNRKRNIARKEKSTIRRSRPGISDQIILCVLTILQ
uniref:Uncharacterized protein n=1 Tax=Rhizophora mucronata TaxID=61149 RepID=A0A2P2NKJ8_RHIMU